MTAGSCRYEKEAIKKTGRGGTKVNNLAGNQEKGDNELRGTHTQGQGGGRKLLGNFKNA